MIAPLSLDEYIITLSIKQGNIKYHFLNIWRDELGLNIGKSKDGDWSQGRPEDSLFNSYYSEV